MLENLKSSILTNNPNLPIFISSNFIELENLVKQYTKENDA